MKEHRLLTKWRERPFSFSQHSSWYWNKEDWFNKYILDLPERVTPELIFGKAFADAAEARTPLAPITMLSIMEQPFNATLEGISLVGYGDTFEETGDIVLGEYKTGVKPWTQKRVDEHLQFTFYLLMKFLADKVTPEQVRLFLQWVPTVKVPRDNGDMSGFDYDIAFASNPPMVHTFYTERTMSDLLALAEDIIKVRKEMEIYAKVRLSTETAIA